MDRTLSALYDHRDDAMSAVEDLVSAGVPRDHISMVSGSEPTETAGAGTGYGTEREERGFWSTLSDFFTSDEDRRTLEESISRGGATLIARVDEGQLDRAVEIMESHHAVDLEEREREWRTQGDGDGPRAMGTMGEETYQPGAPSVGLGPETGGPAAGDLEATTGARAGISGEEEVIPLTEEKLQVGKREVSGGRVRVRTHVVEEPVSEDVRLRDESVTIERTPVDRPLRAGEKAFQDRTFEAEERHEEPVVSKEAHVTDEVRLRKEGSEHVERVEDTLRHTELDVEDDRTTTEKGKS